MSSTEMAQTYDVGLTENSAASHYHDLSNKAPNTEKLSLSSHPIWSLTGGHMGHTIMCICITHRCPICGFVDKSRHSS